MATLICTANTAATLGTRHETYWGTGYVQWGSRDGKMRRGLVVFPELANNALLGREIKDIKMVFVCPNAGRNRVKTAFFYQTTKTEFTGGTSGWWGDYLGSLNGQFYSRTVTINSLKTSYPALFANLAAYLRTGGRALAVYKNESSGSGEWSTNFSQFDSVVMTVTYEESHVWCWDDAANEGAGEWKRCRAHFYRDGQWIPCNTYRHDGTDWVL